MQRLLHYTVVSFGILLILTTALLQNQREGEAPPSVILNIGQGGLSHLELLLPFTQQRIPLTRQLSDIHVLGWTPHGLLYTAHGPEGDTALFRLTDPQAQPEVLANRLWPPVGLSPDRTWVVVMSSWVPTDHFGLTALRADGKQHYPLLTTDATIRQASNLTGPIFTPSGDWIAFGLSMLDGTSDVYRVRLDGTGLENLSLESEGTAEPVAWGSDGQGLVVMSNGQPHYIELDTKHWVPLLAEIPLGLDGPRWVAQNLSAGIGIFAVSHGLEKALYGVRFDGSLVWERTLQYDPMFARNGEWGLVLQETGWVRMRGSDGVGYSIFPPRTAALRWDNVLWSPEGNAAFFVGSPATGDEIWRFDAASGHFTRLWHETSYTYIHQVALSPDGKWITMRADRQFSGGFGLMYSDGSAFRWITDGLNLGPYGFGGWGPAYEKTWSAGVLLLIGVVCVVGAWIRWPRVF